MYSRQEFNLAITYITASQDQFSDWTPCCSESKARRGVGSRELYSEEVVNPTMACSMYLRQEGLWKEHVWILRIYGGPSATTALNVCYY